MTSSFAPRLWTEPSVIKTTGDIRPTSEQKKVAFEVYTALRDGSGIGEKIANKVSKIFKWKKAPAQPKISGPSNTKSSTSASSRVRGSRAPQDISSSVSQDQVILGISEKRMTRNQTAKGSNQIAVDVDVDVFETIPDQIKKPSPPSSKADFRSNKEKEVAQARVQAARGTMSTPVIPAPVYQVTRSVSPPEHDIKEAQMKLAYPQETVCAYQAELISDPIVLSFVAMKDHNMEEEIEDDFEAADDQPKVGPDEDTPDVDTPVSAPFKLSAVPRIRLNFNSPTGGKPNRMDKGKGKALDEDVEDCPEAIENDNTREYPGQVLNTDNESKEPTGASGSSTMGSQTFNASNTPVKSLKKMPPGHEVMDEGLHDRSRVLVGIPRPEALTIVFKTGKEDPKKPGVVQHLANVTYRYKKEALNWESANYIAGLNKWRSQIFSRLLGKKAETRWKWTQGEMNAACDILEAHLTSPEVGGSWANIDWEVVTAVYNDRFEGVTQSAGELYARVRYNSKDGPAISERGKNMGTDREAPVRTWNGIKNQMTHFADPRAIDIVRRARDPKTAVSSGSSTGSESGWPANVPLKRIGFVNGNRASARDRKRFSEEQNGDAAQDLPPNKKVKLDRSATRLRGGHLSDYDGYISDFNYGDDSPPSGDVQGRQFPGDSAFRLASGTRAVQALAEAHRLLGLDVTPVGVEGSHMADQSTSLSHDKKRSREADESYSGEDEEESLPPKKVKMDRRLPRNTSLAPLSASTPTQTATVDQQNPPSNLRKRSRNNDQVHGGDDQEALPTKKTKSETAQGSQQSSHASRRNSASMENRNAGRCPPSPNTPRRNSASMRTQNTGRRPPSKGGVATTKKGFQTTSRLPTLDDYFSEN
ncbi:hypothetical protein SBOR_1782 [Sclerotinia borealis F-4128]|uniref:Uncharacterized protein n=1 Tax=Sclerotinia borealis (strain F-4128) TaxID=1432307 RepID=W9CM45_SCLBF|nr:hypothetical protein SBOR_1782 [Sclerotinia borealis F-4128]